MRTWRLEGSWSLEDQAEDRYRQVEIELPPGTASLQVALTYDRTAGVIDLGCTEAGRLRGWSGGARERFYLSAAHATPGYLGGPLGSGVEVILGLHRIPSSGLTWELEVTLEAPPPSPPGAPAPRQRSRHAGSRDTLVRTSRPLPAPRGSRWLAGDLHCHSEHSDGALAVEDLAALAAARGLDFLAVTDHNTVSHHALLPLSSARSGVVLIPGQEVTTHLGHANAIGIAEWIDFRLPPATWWQRASHGVISVNHPLAGDCSWRHPPLDAAALDAAGEAAGFAEVWHGGGPSPGLLAAIGWGQVWSAANGHRLVPLGGSDWHRPGDRAGLGTPTTWALADEPSCEGVLAALRAARTAVSANASGPLLLRVEDRLIALGASGCAVVGPGGDRRCVGSSDHAELSAPAGPHHLEDASGSVLAITA